MVTSSSIALLLFVLRKFYLKNTCGKAKETSSGFESKRNSWFEWSTSYEGCHNDNLKKISNSFYMFSPNSLIAYGMGGPCYTDEINVDIGKPMM